MQQEATLHLTLLEVVHELLVFLCTEGSRDQRLRFATRKQRRAVRAWQPADFAGDRANFGKTPSIRPAAMVQNIVAENLFFEMVESFLGHRAQLRLILWIDLDNLFLQSIDGGITHALFLTRGVEGRTQALGISTFDLADHFFVQHRRLHGPLLDFQRFIKLFLPATEPVDLFVREHQGLDHDRFRHFLSAGFDHYDRFFRPRDNQIQLRFANLVVSRIDNVPAFYPTDARAGDRRRERNIGEIKRTRRSGDGYHVGIVIRVGRDYRRYHLGFIAITLSE